MIIEISYGVYLFVSIAMTIWVANTLSKNGRVFLINSFNGDEQTADSINHLLVVGFYLLNIGYILLALQTKQDLETLRAAIEFLSKKVGFVLLVIGAIHFSNIFVIARWGRKAGRQRQLHD